MRSAPTGSSGAVSPPAAAAAMPSTACVRPASSPSSAPSRRNRAPDRFLGAGKTTLVRHLLENAQGKKLAVLVNEFGDLGFDGEFLKGCGISGCTEEDVVELPNGCICCTVADDFVPALEKLLNRAESAGAHPDRDLGARAAEAAGPGLQLAGDPLARHGRRRHRRGRRAGRRRGPVRR